MTNDDPLNYTSIDAIITAHERNGGRFFSKDSKRFFKSRVLPTVYADWHNPKCHCFYFITSEADIPRVKVRRYTIRMFNSKTKSITNASSFNAYANIKQAKRDAENYAKGIPYMEEPDGE